jgi:hypothetical protein
MLVGKELATDKGTARPLNLTTLAFCDNNTLATKFAGYCILFKCIHIVWVLESYTRDDVFHLVQVKAQFYGFGFVSNYGLFVVKRRVIWNYNIELRILCSWCRYTRWLYNLLVLVKHKKTDANKKEKFMGPQIPHQYITIKGSRATTHKTRLVDYALLSCHSAMRPKSCYLITCD